MRLQKLSRLSIICLVTLSFGIILNHLLLSTVSILSDEIKAVKKRYTSSQRQFDHTSKSLIKYQQKCNTVIFYNRVPKTGSTTFTAVLYSLAKPNKLYVMHINSSTFTTSNNSNDISQFHYRLRLGDQQSFVQNISNWLDHRPAFVHGHFGYINFEQFGASNPLYINILRDPLERLVSYYYFIRYGDDYRKGLVRPKHGDSTSFNECVKNNGYDCQVKHMWMQIPFLCGQNPQCYIVDNPWALQQAKKNLIEKYLIVGVTEQLEDLVVVLESLVPDVFNGAAVKYRATKKQHIRNTLHKDPLSEETIQIMHSSITYQMEYELYSLAKSLFNSIKVQNTFIDKHNRTQPILKPRRCLNVA